MVPDPLPHVWAKSPRRPGTPGESLTAHLGATLAAVGTVRHRIGPLPGLPETIADRFWAVAAWAALTHDAGKVAAGFQDMVAGRTRSWGHRHEVLSLGFLPGLVGDDDRRWVSLAVGTHHRALYAVPEGGKPTIAQLYAPLSTDELARQLGDIPATDAAALADWLHTTGMAAGLARPHPADDEVCPVNGASLVRRAHTELRALLTDWDLVEPGTGLAAVLLQGAVTTADHLSSAHVTVVTVQPVDAVFAKGWREATAAAGRAVFTHQDAAASVPGHLLLRARTGSGKTEAGLLWAAGQVEALRGHGAGAPRLFYLLPYLASNNAMAGRLAALLGDGDLVGVSHSRAASYHLASSLDDETTDHIVGAGAGTTGAARKAVGRANATRLFRETVRVGTPYQLLRGALAGPAHSSILLDCANSVYVLDELHCYDAKRLGFILASAKLWERLGGRIAVLSATLPAVLEDLLAETLREPVTVVQAPPGASPRHIIRTDTRTLDDDEVRTDIARQVHDGRSVLVVANNVAQAVAAFDALAAVARDTHGPDAAYLLHSRFRRGDRARIEKAIHNRWRTGGPRLPGVLVATQVVEVSLDVDFDILHTSAANLEALIQRFGRVNRVGARPPAPVTVHAPVYGTRRGKGTEEFADGVYARAPVEAAWDLLTVHDGDTVDEDALTGWLNQVYDSDWGRHWRDEVIRERNAFAATFLDFSAPMEDREPLAEDFDRLFDGTEGVLSDDLAAYRTALSTAPGAAGRILGEELLIPLPWYAAARSRWDRDLRVRVIDADYDPDAGLGELRGVAATAYTPGEVL